MYSPNRDGGVQHRGCSVVVSGVQVRARGDERLERGAVSLLRRPGEGGESSDQGLTLVHFICLNEAVLSPVTTEETTLIPQLSLKSSDNVDDCNPPAPDALAHLQLARALGHQQLHLVVAVQVAFCKKKLETSFSLGRFTG